MLVYQRIPVFSEDCYILVGFLTSEWSCSTVLVTLVLLLEDIPAKGNLKKKGFVLASISRGMASIMEGKAWHSGRNWLFMTSSTDRKWGKGCTSSIAFPNSTSNWGQCSNKPMQDSSYSHLYTYSNDMWKRHISCFMIDNLPLFISEVHSALPWLV